jgi:death-on-curing protein
MISGLDPEDLLLVLGESTGPETRVRDGSILCASAQRPEAVILGHVVLNDLASRAGALLHSITLWEPLDMWNASFAWRATRALIKVNACDLEMSHRDRMALTTDLISRELEDVEDIAGRLKPFMRIG